jgi:hypothetical protein
MVPQPLPLSAVAVGNDPASVPQEVLTIVRQIGYEDAELRADLAGEGLSMAKVFVAMLMARRCPGEIPWENRESADAGVLSAQSFMDPAGGVMLDSKDPFRRRLRTPRPGSLTVRSAAFRPQWAMDPDPEAGPIAEDDGTVEGLPLCEVMACIQRAADEASLEFVHPDPATLFCRGQAMAATIFATIGSGGLVEVGAMLHRGGVEAFKAFTGRMRELLKQEADAESW